MKVRRKENVMSKIRHPATLSGPRRKGRGKGSYLFVVLTLVVVAGAVMGIEALRRFSSRPAAERPNAFAPSGVPRATEIRRGRNRGTDIVRTRKKPDGR